MFTYDHPSITSYFSLGPLGGGVFMYFVHASQYVTHLEAVRETYLWLLEKHRLSCACFARDDVSHATCWHLLQPKMCSDYHNCQLHQNVNVSSGVCIVYTVYLC